MRRYLQAVWAIASKDVRAELATRQATSLTFVFGFLVLVIFSFAFDPSAEAVATTFPGLMWLAFFFASTLALGRAFSYDREHDLLTGLLLAPIDASAIYFGKLLAGLAFALGVEAVLTPLFLIVLNVRFERLDLLPAAIALGTLGFLAAGMLLSALAAHTRAAESLLPVILFPIAVPVVIASVRLTQAILSVTDPDAVSLWFRVLVGYDIVFLVLPWLLFDNLLER